jgi:hypothetical protein
MNLIRKSSILITFIFFFAAIYSRAAAQPDTNDDAARQKAIAGFTQKMKDANYPTLFDKAAKEFSVPPDVLKGVAFAETRWSHHQWPPGETVSPENGMPRAYGIMALMDDDHFGHSLIAGAALIGEDPDLVKADAYQNMRAGAALLRKLYDETPKPADAPGDQIESWRKAIVKYCGIPQPELSESHALHVYEFMNDGYHQYGIDWDAHPVNLGPMREEVAKFRAEARNKIDATLNSDEMPGGKIIPPSAQATPAIPASTAPPANTSTQTEAEHAEALRQRWYLLGLIFVLLGVGVFYRLKRRQQPV